MSAKAQLQPTAEQIAAVHTHDSNLIVVAGAGSGKTRVLVERYLQLLEDNPGWKLNSLVAITFTREAAYEMRQRIRLEIERRDEEGARSLWSRHLAEIDSARIDTIHGLCASILRANAAEAGIDPKFDVLDETEAQILIEKAVEDVLQRLDPNWLALFAAYDARKISDTLHRAELVNADLPDTAPDSAELFDQWQRQWSDCVIQARDRILNCEAVQQLQGYGNFPVDDKLGDLASQYRGYLAQMSEAADTQKIARLMKECYDGGRVGNIGSANAWGDKETKQAVAVILRDFRENIKRELEGTGEKLDAHDRESAAVLRIWMQLLLEVQRTYRQKKEQNAQLDFDDLERLAAQVLRNPTIQNRYRDSELNHLLVDEFQDTNQSQWQIIQSLADLGRGGTLFVVGDPKQSIYQFRGADVSVFNHVRDSIAAHGSGEALQLSTSFRSHARLIALFNHLFERILTRDDNSAVADYEVPFDMPMTAFREESPADAPIECLLLDIHERDEDGNYVPHPKRGNKRIPADDLRRWEAFELSRHIHDMIAAKRPVYDRDLGCSRAIAYGDIAILFQALSNIGIYEDVFKSQYIPFLTIAGRGYYDRQEVWDMLDLLRCLHNPLDNLSLASVLRSPMFGFSDDLLFALRLLKDPDTDSNESLPLWHALSFALSNPGTGITADDLDLLGFAEHTLDELKLMAGRVTISELLRQALYATGYLAILSALPDGPRRRGNVEKLLQLADDSGKITLGKFSRYLNDMSAREIREGEVLMQAGNAVKLMTVHASKGLEFPLVILADSSWTRTSGAAPTVLKDREFGLSCQVFDVESNKYISAFAHRRNTRLQAQKEAAERKRLLYVAATRAQDYLVISGQVRCDQHGNWSARGWLQELVDAFELRGIDRRVDQLHAFAGDSIRVLMPPAPPPRHILYGGYDTSQNLWDSAETTEQIPSLSFPLIDPLPAASETRLRHISTSQLTDLCEYRISSGQDREYFRNRVLSGDSQNTTRLPESACLGQARLSRRLLGTIVHDLLRYGIYEDDRNMIKSFAWQHGLTSAQRLEETIAAVRHLLAGYRRSKVHDWITSARADKRPLFTELPFIYRTSARIIHGVLDVLLQREDGSWAIIDFKTTSAPGDLAQFTRRYHLQLAVYAAAIQAQLSLSIPPQTFVHYLPDNKTVTIERDECLAELEKLEPLIGSLEAHRA